MRTTSITVTSLLVSVFLFGAIASGQSTDAMLRDTLAKDRSSRDATGKLITLSAAEHIARGNIYLDSRHFPESREHYSRVIEVYPSDAGMARALMGMGRSLMWERRCDEAIPWFDRASREFPATKDGRESLAFKGACHVRTGKNVEAAAIYEKYTVMYPGGERVDSAYLNIIDALREAGKYEDAAAWVQKTRQRFPSMPTSTNAMQALIRMEIFRGRWNEAIAAADASILNGAFAGSMTSADEIRFLRGFALERAGRNADAIAAYSSIPDNTVSYYSGLAAEKLAARGSRVKRTVLITPRVVQDFPAPFRPELLRYAKPKNVDPRFVLAIMKQESAFKPNAKSPAAARGLLQIVFDTATKYNKKAGFELLQPDDLYKPSVNIAIGIEYIADLKGQFGGLYEAIAASYNGGEDNAVRWLNRTKPREPGIFASEVGFAETKNYVMKVMANYRVYRELYDENLNRR